jgi:hypothetical protein
MRRTRSSADQDGPPSLFFPRLNESIGQNRALALCGSRRRTRMLDWSAWRSKKTVARKRHAALLVLNRSLPKQSLKFSPICS